MNRKPEQDALVKKRYLKFASDIETILIKDFFDPDSFKQGLAGATYVIHLATPMPNHAGTDFRKDFAELAVNATLAVLKAALGCPQIKKVIVMSSSVALLPVSVLARPDLEHEVTENTGEVIPVDFIAEVPQGLIGQVVRYSASKIVAHQATRNFVKEKKPDYTLITLHPTYVIGYNLTQETAEGLSGINSLQWKSFASEKPLIGTSWIHVQDVADAHIKVIQVNFEHGKEFALSGPTFPWQDAIEDIHKEFSGLEAKLVPPFEGSWKVDVTGAETVLGLVWSPKVFNY
ncbi:dihydroflavonal-4-reductase [Phaeosphaeria sp. MPI-PUGE-AT-0046c]|nr:dihydroflavonal-4-reductase [Phaeosphaeria sp. MPI-PUGE-AT-0046c]